MPSPTTSTRAEGDYLFDGWFDPIEAGLRTQVRGFSETLLEEELTAVCRDRATAAKPTRTLAPACPATGMGTARGS